VISKGRQDSKYLPQGSMPQVESLIGGFQPIERALSAEVRRSLKPPFVYRGSMYAELSGRPWPDQLVDLCGPAV